MPAVGASGAVLLEWIYAFRFLVCGLERAWPRRPFQHGVVRRWAGNASLLVASLVTVRLLFAPGAAVGVAWWCEQNGFGLSHRLGVPRGVAAVAGWLVLDLAMWLQHWVQHRIGFLWRVHRVHHTDLDLDWSTALRFHPFEAWLATFVRIVTVALLGVPLVGALAYEVGLSLSSTITHASLRIPPRLDAALRLVLTTPDVHRIHHSAEAEMETNYGSVLTVWDRLLGTYRAQPRKGHLDMELGLPDHRDASALHPLELFVLPFRRLGPR